MSRRIPKNRTQRSLRRPAREAYSTRTVEFTSPPEADRDDRDVCVGRLYLPDGPEDPPTVVMAPGLGMWRTFGFPAYAERFAEAGYAAVLFDYRGFNDSEGEPRALIDPTRQQEDYRAAIAALERLDVVSTDELVLWGFSLSGGHVLSIAADRFDVDAVIAVCPFTDGRAVLKRYLKRPRTAGRMLARGGRDRIGRRIGLGRSIPIVGEPDSGAVIDAPGSKREFLDLIDRESTWRNLTPARLFLSLPRYRPIESVEDIRAATLCIAGTDDRLTPAADVELVADRIDRSTLVRMPTTHYGVFGPEFEASIGHQLTFLADRFE